MSDPTADAQQAAEKAVRDVAAAFGQRDVPEAVVKAAAGMVLGAVALATGLSLRHAERAGQAAADAILTDADAAKELGR